MHGCEGAPPRRRPCRTRARGVLSIMSSHPSGRSRGAPRPRAPSFGSRVPEFSAAQFRTPNPSYSRTNRQVRSQLRARGGRDARGPTLLGDPRRLSGGTEDTGRGAGGPGAGRRGGRASDPAVGMGRAAAAAGDSRPEQRLLGPRRTRRRRRRGRLRLGRRRLRRRLRGLRRRRLLLLEGLEGLEGLHQLLQRRHGGLTPSGASPEASGRLAPRGAAQQRGNEWGAKKRAEAEPRPPTILGPSRQPPRRPTSRDAAPLEAGPGQRD